MKAFMLMLFSLLLSFALLAQENYKISGYVQTSLGNRILRAQEEGRNKFELYQLNANALRINIESEVTENLKAFANFDMVRYQGKTDEWNSIYLLADKFQKEIRSGRIGEDGKVDDQIGLFEYDYSNQRAFLDNAYITYDLPKWKFVVGRQPISYGKGRSWTPSNVLTPFGSYLHARGPAGRNGFRVDYKFSDNHTLTSFLILEENWDYSTKMLALKGQINEDLSYELVGSERQFSYHDYKAALDKDARDPGDGAGDNYVELTDERHLLGGSIETKVSGLGLWAEIGHSWVTRISEQDTYYTYTPKYTKKRAKIDTTGVPVETPLSTIPNYTELTLGVEYTFENALYGRVEYFLNTLGKDNWKQYDINNWMRYFMGESRSVSRQLLNVATKYPLNDEFSLHLRTAYSFSDGSIKLQPMMTYKYSDSVDILTYVNLNTSEDGKQYSRIMGRSLWGRIRINF